MHLDRHNNYAITTTNCAPLLYTSFDIEAQTSSYLGAPAGLY